MEIYDRPFGDYDFAKIIEDMARPKWRYGHASVSKDHDIPFWEMTLVDEPFYTCLLYTSPSPRDRTRSRMPSSA